eukprot:2700140-Prymnesium_polylepis.1
MSGGGGPVQLGSAGTSSLPCGEWRGVGFMAARAEGPPPSRRARVAWREGRKRQHYTHTHPLGALRAARYERCGAGP